LKPNVDQYRTFKEYSSKYSANFYRHERRELCIPEFMDDRFRGPPTITFPKPVLIGARIANWRKAQYEKLEKYRAKAAIQIQECKITRPTKGRGRAYDSPRI